MSKTNLKLSETIKPNWEPNWELEDLLKEFFIDPLKKLGFEFGSYISTKDPTSGVISHTLYFNHDQKTLYTEEALQDICIQDDYNQPYSAYREYFGTLWVFIPACP